MTLPVSDVADTDSRDDANVGRGVTTTASATARHTLKRGILAAFTLPTLVLYIMHGPGGQIQSIYAKHAGVTLAALAAATLLTKLFDAFTYPLIGYLSDKTYARRGTRKDWVVAGMLVSVLGVWKLMRPPHVGVDAVYYGVWMAVTYVGWKLMEIPLQAWSYGLSEDYAQRSRVQAWRGLASLSGQLLFFLIPFLAVKIGFSDSTELDFRSLGLSAVICAVALPLATLIAVVFVPNGVATPPPTTSGRAGFAEVFNAIRKNPPLLRLLAAFLPVNLFGGLSSGVIYLYVDTYLGLGKQFPAIMLLAMLAGIIGIPFWSALAARFERHRVWAISLVTGGIAAGTLAWSSPGPMALPLVLVAYTVIALTLVGAVIVYAMSADIVDYGRLVTGEDHAGLYGSIFAFLQKSLLGVSAAAGLALVGLFGFDATATSQTASGVLGIKFTASFLPALGLLGAAIIIWNYPLTRARVAEIQAQLHLGEDRSRPVDPG
jgi:Na+/melibiose symporter-like transporter